MSVGVPSDRHRNAAATAPATIAALLEPAAVDFETLDRRYGALLELVRRLIGVVPNCDPLLEIWPPGFRTYNLMVPNFLNLPFLLFGAGPPKDVIGLAAYASSRAAGCAYCSAHTCSFALRRGATPQQVAEALDPGASHSAAQRSAIVAAAALSQVPSTFRPEHLEELERHFSAANVEWIALSVAMMGFLNKFMDAVGVELERPTIAEVDGVIAPSGWDTGKHWNAADTVSPGDPPRPDTFRTTLGVLRLAPRAIKLDRRWTQGVPKSWPAIRDDLLRSTGHDFPLLGQLRHARPRRALAAMIRHNLNPAESVIGLRAKHLAGLVYATVVADEPLAAQERRLAARAGATPAAITATERFAAARGGAKADADLAAAAGDADAQLVALALAKEAAPSPATITPATLQRLGQALAPPATVELLVWLSLLQLLHRLHAFDAVRSQAGR